MNKPNHTNQEALFEKIQQAKKIIVIGGKYYHYKSPDSFYTVFELGIMESDESVTVLYKNNFGIIWIREINNFNETIFVDGIPTKRFTYIPE